MAQARYGFTYSERGSGLRIHNTVPYFLENYTPSLEFLLRYHEKFSDHFIEYFLYHCKNPEEKIAAAIRKYPCQLSAIQESSGKIENLIHQVTLDYKQQFNVYFNRDVHIIVGVYGSNAYTHRQVIPEVTFCLEQLSPKEDHLKVIIAHEFGHALHNILTDQEGMDWSRIQWFHPFTILLQEGCATYFSEKIVTAEKPAYFSFDDKGAEWLDFAVANQATIIARFLEDTKRQTRSEIFHEWFSINGGSTFGYTRLGYFIGYRMVRFLIDKFSEEQAVVLWKESSFYKEVEQALVELI